MTTTTKADLLEQLRTVLDLTNTEIQVAETRIAQARTEAVSRELTENAQNGRSRAEAIESAIRELGGVPDVIGYLSLCGLPVGDHVARAAELHRYRREVFIAPPWPEIFTQDAERKQSLNEAEATYHALAGAYERCGYGLVPLPRVLVAERVRFVLSRIG